MTFNFDTILCHRRMPEVFKLDLWKFSLQLNALVEREDQFKECRDERASSAHAPHLHSTL